MTDDKQNCCGNPSNTEDCDSRCQAEHPGRWPVKFEEYLRADTRLAHVTRGEVAITRDYILQVERERDELKERLTFQKHRGDTYLDNVNRLQQENAELRKRIEELENWNSERIEMAAARDPQPPTRAELARLAADWQKERE